MPSISEIPGLYYPDWAHPAPANSLKSGVVHIWRASLDAHYHQRDRLTGFLAPDELNRASRFHFERDRSRYSIGRGLLRLLIGRYLDRHPAALSFVYTLRAKPYLPNPDTLAFNVSHSHGMALYCFGHNFELGIDIERHNQALDTKEIAHSFFTPAEARFILQNEPDGLHERFFFLWSRKEAYIKARAEGLYLPLNEFDVANRSSVDGFDIHSFLAWPHFPASLAVKPRPSQVLFFDFDLVA